MRLAISRLISIVGVCALAFALMSRAHAEVAIPDELKLWQGWVLHGEEFRRCPFFANRLPNGNADFVCAWPEKLTLNVSAQGAEFTQHWQVFVDAWIALPGNNELWPRNVRLNGAPAAVVTHEGLPSLRLSAGTYTVSGSLAWSTRPEQIPIPSQTGIVDLMVDGRDVAQPERPDGAVWLGKRRTAEQAQQLSMQVYRLVKDDVPTRLTTQIRLQVSGEAREESLGKALPKDFVPMSINSMLPVRIEKDGTLRAQLRPGQWVIAIEARGADVMNEITPSSSAEEVWSYQANDRLRVTAVEGVDTIDPAQANAPPEWHGLPTYRMTQESQFRIIERSRGLANQDANQLNLSRQLWYDFDHHGFTVVDSISGTMRKDWRLDMAKPFALASARTLGDSAQLLVTKGAQEELSGVELRSPNLNVQTIARLEQSSGRIPATGWQTRFASVSGQLNLPPGHRLISALGDAESPSSWTAQWGLLDFFIVLIVTVGAWRLRGLVFASLTLGALILIHQEQSTFAWLLVNVLIAMALVGVAPLGRLKIAMEWYRALSFGVLVLAFAPFALNQVRMGLYPQLGATFGYTGQTELAQSVAPAVDAPPPAPAVMMDSSGRVEEESDGSANRREYAKRVFTRSSPSASVVQRYAPGTVVQTGPGVPNWNFISYPYSWSGPVDVNESVHFIIATPLWMFIWRVLGVALLGAVIVFIARTSFQLNAVKTIVQPFMKGAPVASVVAVLGAMLFIAPPSSQAAGSPDAQVLAELKARLTQPPVCAPNCAEAQSAQVSVTADRLDLTLEMSALANVAVGIPVAAGRWEPETITIDGQSAGAVYRDPQHAYWVALKSGAHTLKMSGRLAAAESIQLVFPLRPRVIAVVGSGWEFSGINESRLLTNTLELVRQRSSDKAGDKLSASSQFAPFVRVRRLVNLDLDWTVTTIVERVAPDKGAFTVEIPLLKNEQVLTSGMTLREREGVRSVLVGLSAGEGSLSWTSTLPRGEAMELSMLVNDNRTEQWTFSVSPIWNVQFEGVPQVAPDDMNAASWTFDYFPRAKETLKVNVFRPLAVEGQTLAIDSVLMTSDIGKRSTNASLQLSYRSTQGGRHSIVLPKDAQVTSVMVDGGVVSVRPQDGELPLSLLPGAHTLGVTWQTDRGTSLRAQSGAVDLKAPASNITTRINLGNDRWVLFTRGQGIGPAVLYWGELIVFIVIAYLLGRYTESPLKLHDWLLLGLGLSTFSWSVLLLFAIWIFVMRWRNTAEFKVIDPKNDDLKFNTIQIAIAVLTVFAVGSLVAAIPNGLLRHPDMSIRSPGEGYSWFVDQSVAMLPSPSVISVPLIIYKVAILLWALWLSFALLRWLPWAWSAYNANGLWRGPVARNSTRAYASKSTTDNPTSST